MAKVMKYVLQTRKSLPSIIEPEYWGELVCSRQLCMAQPRLRRTLLHKTKYEPEVEEYLNGPFFICTKAKVCDARMFNRSYQCR